MAGPNHSQFESGGNSSSVSQTTKREICILTQGSWDTKPKDKFNSQNFFGVFFLSFIYFFVTSKGRGKTLPLTHTPLLLAVVIKYGLITFNDILEQQLKTHPVVDTFNTSASQV